MSCCSLFAAQAGASRVIAVEASVRMASVATQVIVPLTLFFKNLFIILFFKNLL